MQKQRSSSLQSTVRDTVRAPQGEESHVDTIAVGGFRTRLYVGLFVALLGLVGFLIMLVIALTARH